MKTTRFLYIKQNTKKVHRKRRILKISSLFLVVLGLFLITYVAAPILQWQLFYATSLSSGNIIAPIPGAITLKSNGIGSVLASGESGSFDSTKASQWFPRALVNGGNGKEYSLSIAKLGIKEAKVIVGADDLEKSLIQYGGSSMPGEFGNAVIFGHSVLPQFFNTGNYKTIFSTLHTLTIGDKVQIAYDGVSYQYSVFDFKVVEATDISVLEQNYDNSYLTIVTCTPPGTLWKRLVVKAKIDRLAGL